MGYVLTVLAGIAFLGLWRTVVRWRCSAMIVCGAASWSSSGQNRSMCLALSRPSSRRNSIAGCSERCWPVACFCWCRFLERINCTHGWSPFLMGLIAVSRTH